MQISLFIPDDGLIATLDIVAPRAGRIEIEAQ